MTLEKEFQIILKKIEKQTPLIHHITNYVTANDCANTILALGGSPVMADDEQEVEEMVALSSALVLNIGTLSQQKLGSFILAGKKANELGIPVILDPVGLGTTNLRRRLVGEILSEIDLTVIRGNMSEMLNLYGTSVETKGVDSSVDTENGGEEIAKTLAQNLHCTVGITGKVDILSDGNKTYRLENGHALLSKVTGTGCMTTSIIGLCCTGHTLPIYAAMLGLSIMGISGEIAADALAKDKSKGLGSYKVHLFDALSNFTTENYLERGKIYEI